MPEEVQRDPDTACAGDRCSSAAANEGSGTPPDEGEKHDTGGESTPDCDMSCCGDENIVEVNTVEEPASGCNAGCCGGINSALDETESVENCCSVDKPKGVAVYANACCAPSTAGNAVEGNETDETAKCQDSCCGSDAGDGACCDENEDSATGCAKCDSLSKNGEQPCCDGQSESRSPFSPTGT